jgi:hypothetical protein
MHIPTTRRSPARHTHHLATRGIQWTPVPGPILAGIEWAQRGMRQDRQVTIHGWHHSTAPLPSCVLHAGWGRRLACETEQRSACSASNGLCHAFQRQEGGKKPLLAQQRLGISAKQLGCKTTHCGAKKHARGDTRFSVRHCFESPCHARRARGLWAARQPRHVAQDHGPGSWQASTPPAQRASAGRISTCHWRSSSHVAVQAPQALAEIIAQGRPAFGPPLARLSCMKPPARGHR